MKSDEKLGKLVENFHKAAELGNGELNNLFQEAPDNLLAKQNGFPEKAFRESFEYALEHREHSIVMNLKGEIEALNTVLGRAANILKQVNKLDNDLSKRGKKSPHKAQILEIIELFRTVVNAAGQIKQRQYSRAA